MELKNVSINKMISCENNLRELEKNIENMTLDELDLMLESLEETKDKIYSLKEKAEEKNKFYKKLDSYFAGASFDNVMAMINILDTTFEKELKRIKEIESKNKGGVREVTENGIKKILVVEETEELLNKKGDNYLEKMEELIKQGKFPFNR
jgi:hypothetical protein